MDRLERLVNLVAALIDASRPLSREEIRVRVGGYSDENESFRRNFERDKDLLRQMGLPVELEPLTDGDARGDGHQHAQMGYRIRRDAYELPDPGLLDDELEALRLAASTVSIQGGWATNATTAALRKLAAATDGSGGSAPQAETAPGNTAPGHTAPEAGAGGVDIDTDPRVATVFAAVAACQAVRFKYRGQRRTIDPWHLAFRRGHWYLTGRDHARDAERMYRLDRVEGDIETSGDPGSFVRPEHVVGEAPPPWRMGDEPEVIAEIAVDAAQARFAEAAVGSAAVKTRKDDGGIVVRLAVTNRASLRSFVLGLLDHAEILAPPELRADMVDWLKALAGSEGVG